MQASAVQLYWQRDSSRCFTVNFAKSLRTSFCKRLFLKIWNLIYDSGHPQQSDKKLSRKCLEYVQEHMCIGFQLLSCKFRETKDWLNPHSNCRVQQNLKNKLMGLHFSNVFLSGLICRGGGIFGGAYSVSIKIN